MEDLDIKKTENIPARIANLISESIVDGPGIRFVVFFQGCPRNCEGCHNPATQGFEGGTLLSISDIMNKIKRNTLLDGVTLSGGEPFEQALQAHIISNECKMLGLNVMVYSGYTFEELYEGALNNTNWDKLLRIADILVDGPFVIEKKSLTLSFRGSTNQRIIDVQASLLNYDKGNSQVVTMDL